MKRSNLHRMQLLAKQRNGRCLSNKYINNSTKLRWRCEQGHIWEAMPYSISLGTWCPYCAHLVKHTIDEMHALAHQHGGTCLSTEYKSIFHKLRWQCEHGHVWEANPVNIQYNSWCPYCSQCAKHTIGEMQTIAETHHGKCLSNTYINVKTKLQFQCEHGHVWETTPASILRRHWCPCCVNRMGKKNGTLATASAASPTS